MNVLRPCHRSNTKEFSKNYDKIKWEKPAKSKNERKK